MKISIITATYNSAKTLHDNLNSVLNQSYKDFEHIIIDGKSTDETLRIIKEYEPKYQGKLKWISEFDNGLYDAMNKGLKMATGDVIGLLNSDDFYYDENTLGRIANTLSKNLEVDAMYADNMIVGFDDTSKVVRIHTNQDFKQSKMKYGFMPSHPTFYCRKKVFDKYGYFDTSFRIAADFDWLLRTIYVNKISTIYSPGFLTKMRTGGLSQSGFKSHVIVMKEHLRSYKKYGVKSNIINEIYRLIYKFLCKTMKKSY